MPIHRLIFRRNSNLILLELIHCISTSFLSFFRSFVLSLPSIMSRPCPYSFTACSSSRAYITPEMLVSFRFVSFLFFLFFFNSSLCLFFPEISILSRYTSCGVEPQSSLFPIFFCLPLCFEGGNPFQRFFTSDSS